MKKLSILNTLVLILLTFFSSCNQGYNKADIEKYKKEIVQAEADFCKMAEEKGIGEAFIAFAAPNATLKRNKKLLIGFDAIKEKYGKNNPYLKGDKLVWKPDFVDVSTSGDLGYTYGKFTFSYIDSTGTVKESNGYFHTVWKRQKDGKWKYVWD